MGVSNKQIGFTLIEVILAIVILAGSLVILLGLQSASISKALRDRNQLQAMLVARNILAAIEIQNITSDRDDNEPVYQLLQDLNAIPEEDEEEELMYSEMQARLLIEEWENPEALQELDLIDSLLKRVYLQIYWGESPDDQMEIVYFVANNSEQEL